MKQKGSKVEVSEKSYIQISNVNKIRIAMEILRGVIPDEIVGDTDKDYIVRILYKWHDNLHEAIEIESSE